MLPAIKEPVQNNYSNSSITNAAFSFRTFLFPKENNNPRGTRAFFEDVRCCWWEGFINVDCRDVLVTWSAELLDYKHRIVGRRKQAFDHSSGVNGSSETQAEAAALVCVSLAALQSASAARQRSFKWKLSFKFPPLLLLTQDSFLRKKYSNFFLYSFFSPLPSSLAHVCEDD